MPLHVADTAGLRDEADVVEAEGIRRARQEMTRADRILYVVDGEHGPEPAAIERELATLPADVPVTLVVNKIDLLAIASRYEQSQPPRLYVSAITGEGIDLLREHLKECMGFQGADSGTVSARRRHLDALARARSASARRRGVSCSISALPS